MSVQKRLQYGEVFGYVEMKMDVVVFRGDQGDLVKLQTVLFGDGGNDFCDFLIPYRISPALYPNIIL